MGTTLVEVRVDTPDGPLFSRTGPSGRAATGKWVWNATVFYLQDVSGGLPLDSTNTLSTVTITLDPFESFLPAFARILCSQMSLHHKLLWLAVQIRRIAFRLGTRNLEGRPSWHRLLHMDAWLRGIPDELEYWTKCLRDPHSAAFRDPVNDQRLLEDPLILDRLREIPDHRVAVLDVGAGPMPRIGRADIGKAIDVTPVDALAAEYGRMRRRVGLSSHVPIVPCHGEELTKAFAPESFDVAYARNSLDHSFAPLLVIRNMLSLVKRGRWVLLRHYVDEGSMQRYHGLHQWNFNMRQGDFLIWDESGEYNLTQELRHEASVHCYYEDAVDGKRKWIVCVIRKKS